LQYCLHRIAHYNVKSKQLVKYLIVFGKRS